MDLETVFVLIVLPALLWLSCVAYSVYEYIIRPGKSIREGLRDWLRDSDSDDWWW